MNFSSLFFRTTSVCAILVSALFLVMWLLGFLVELPIDLFGFLVLKGDIIYPIWVLIHTAAIFFMLAALWGASGKKMKTAAGLASLAFFFALVYFICQLLSNLTKLLPLAHALAGWEDPKYSPLKSDLIVSLFSVMSILSLAGIICMLVSLALYGLATWRGVGAEKAVSAFFFLSFICLAFYLIAVFSLEKWLFALMNWICWPVFAIGNFLLAWWLWRKEQTA